MRLPRPGQSAGAGRRVSPAPSPRISIPLLGLDHAVFDDIPIEEFLDGSPTLIFWIISVDQNLSQIFASVGGQVCLRRADNSLLGQNGWSGCRIIDHRLQHRSHRFGWNVSLPFHDFSAVSVENDRGRPAIVLIAIGKSGRESASTRTAT